MKPEYKYLAISALIAIGMALCYLVTVAEFNAQNDYYIKLRNDCEKDLPRSQHCYLVAVPYNRD